MLMWAEMRKRGIQPSLHGEGKGPGSCLLGVEGGKAKEEYIVQPGFSAAD